MGKQSMKKIGVAGAAIVFVAAAFMFTGSGKQPAEAAPSKQSKPTKAAKSARDIISESLKAKKPVVLYFYADQIKDSLNDVKKAEQAAAKIKGVLVKAEAYREQDLSYDYGVEYVPSVFVLRPGVGVADAYIVDIDGAGISGPKSLKISPGMEGIKKGVSSKKPTLVFFMADWCGYCRNTIPEVDKYKKAYGNEVNVVAVDIERDSRIAEVYLVTGVPVLLALDANGSINRRMGYPSGYSDFEKVFGRLGVKKKTSRAAGGGGA